MGFLSDFRLKYYVPIFPFKYRYIALQVVEVYVFFKMMRM